MEYPLIYRCSRHVTSEENEIEIYIPYWETSILNVRVESWMFDIVHNSINRTLSRRCGPDQLSSNCHFHADRFHIWRMDEGRCSFHCPNIKDNLVADIQIHSQDGNNTRLAK